MFNNGSQFSFEEQGLLFPFFILAFLLSLFLIYNFTIITKQYKKENEVDYTLVFISVALLFECMSIGLKFLHLLEYSYNGIGILIFNYSSDISYILSQFIIGLVLLLLSFGWTIKYNNLTNFEWFIPIIISFTFV